MRRRSGLPGRSTLAWPAHLVEGARPHANGERGDTGRGRLLAAVGGGGRTEEVLRAVRHHCGRLSACRTPPAREPGAAHPSGSPRRTHRPPPSHAGWSPGSSSRSRASPSRSAVSPVSRSSSGCTPAPRPSSRSRRAPRQVIAQSQPALETLTMQVTGADLTDAGGRGRGRSRDARGRPGPRGQERAVATARRRAASPTRRWRRSSRAGRPAAGGFVTVVDFEPGLDKAAQDEAETAGRAAAARGRRRPWTPRAPSAARARSSRRSRRTVERDLLRGEGIALPLTFIVMFFVFGGFVAAGMPIVGARRLDRRGPAVALRVLARRRARRDRRQHRDPARPRAVHRLRPAHREPVPRGARPPAAPGAHARGDRPRRRADGGDGRPHRPLLRPHVAIALAGLLVFEASIMRAIGVAGVSVVLVAMVVAITLVPALCVVGAKRLSRKAVEQAADVGVFSRLAVGVQRRPVARHPRRRRRARRRWPCRPCR